jgi:hypothetical protein
MMAAVASVACHRPQAGGASLLREHVRDKGTIPRPANRRSGPSLRPDCSTACGLRLPGPQAGTPWS